MGSDGFEKVLIGTRGARNVLDGRKGEEQPERSDERRKTACDAAAAFLERVNGKAIVPGEGDIVVSDDIACGTLGCGGL